MSISEPPSEPPGFRKGQRVRVKMTWFNAGKTGRVLFKSVFVAQWWTPVLWDNEDDPDFFKSRGLEKV